MASNTDYVDQEIKPIMREISTLMEKLKGRQVSYNALGGENFISSTDIGLAMPMGGFVELTGQEVVDGMSTVNALLAVWESGHSDNVAKVLYKK